MTEKIKIEREVKCRNCVEWTKNNGYCRPFQRIIKSPDKLHFCKFYNFNRG